MSRLVFPLAFVIALIAFAMVFQSLQTSTNSQQSAEIKSDLLQQYQIVPIPVPETSVTNSDQKKDSLSEVKTGKTILTFWSAECGECEAGLPVLDQFATDHPDVRVVLVNYKNDKETADAKLKELNIKLPTYYDFDGSNFISWEAVMPSSYFIQNGQVTIFFPGRVSVEHLNALLTI